ncbi:protein Wnt-4 [Tribolium madens]|uniref:protein Wnt-4 n=1 Tax=Tribolium madens TaxID=41895 RepID=UPI001CF7501F|nr:protein Wnt-4 [Tribolium madens]
MLSCIFLLLVINIFSTSETPNRVSTALRAQRKKPFAALVFSGSNNNTPFNKNPCFWLSRLKYQSKICWRQRGLPDVLLNARNLSIISCQNQFRFDQWNCSNREFFFKKIYRETAFMHAMAAAALTFSIARACSDGTLAGCQCGQHGKSLNSTEWQWGGCSDNIKFAKKFSTRFLQLRKKDLRHQNPIVKYNSEVGIRVVINNVQVKCKCHGLSGSCGLKVCFRKIQAFDYVSKQLKGLYHSAIYVEHENYIRPYKSGKTGQKLVFLENSPNFCPSTVERHCNNTENCATLCCGRGFYTTQIPEINKCMCRWRKEIFNVECKYCKENKTIFRCK